MQFWPLYPKLFLTSDNNDHRRALARAYIQKVFANDKWVHSRNRDNKGGGALPPDNELVPSRVRKSPSIATSLVVMSSYILEKAEAVYGQDKLYAAKGGG